MLDKDPSENGREVEGKGLHKELLAIIESEVLVWYVYLENLMSTTSRPGQSQGYAIRQTKPSKTIEGWTCWNSITSNHSVAEPKEHQLLSTVTASHYKFFHTMFGSKTRRSIEEA